MDVFMKMFNIKLALMGFRRNDVLTFIANQEPG